jgi:hypothetical protein
MLIIVNLIATVIAGLALAATLRPQDTINQIPRFDDHTVTEEFTGTPADPILNTPEKRRYRARIRQGVSNGQDVWSGNWKNPAIAPGPNFAGHYFIIRWGCGSECVTMAIVDARTGIVYEPPLAAKGSLFLPLDSLSHMEVDFRINSSLIVLRDACRDFRDRRTCGLYYFDWQDNRFRLLKFVRVDRPQR